MMTIKRLKFVNEAGIGHVMICGSHSHHGPSSELIDKQGTRHGQAATFSSWRDI